jgi:hypothetical protein
LNHPLDGARLKIERAQEHLDSLKAELDMFLGKDPYHFNVEGNEDAVTFQPIIHAAPLRFSTIIGDVVTNSRAALDYIAWQLANRHFSDPVLDPIEDKRWVSFPISENLPRPDDGFSHKMNRFANRKIPAPALTLIRDVQPYNPGYKSLWWLHELVNEDKHRMPLLTVGEVRTAHVVIGKGDYVHRMYFGRIPDDGRVTFQTSPPPPSKQPDAAMDVRAEAGVSVMWKDVTLPRESADRTLEQIIKAVTNIIPRFDAFF